MEQNIHTLGILVNNLSPMKNEENIKIESIIELEFNTDIKVETLFDSIKVLKDVDDYVTEYDILKAKHLYEEVLGDISYRDRILKFTPKENLKCNSKYTIFINNELIKDINDNCMLLPFMSSFKTGSNAILNKPKIIYPKDNSTLKEFNKVILESNNFTNYTVQISRSKKFNPFVYEKIHIAQTSDNYASINVNVENLKLTNGNYYLKVIENDNNVESDIIQFEINSLKDMDLAVSKDDFLNYNAPKESVELKSTFPSNNSFNINPKLNILTFIFNSKIEEDDIYDYGIYFSDISSSYNQNEIDRFNYTINIEYDEIKNETKIKFIFDEEFKLYSKEQNLELNKEYICNLNILNEEYKFKFYTKIDSIFGTVADVRVECGEFISEIKDIDIIKKLYEYSLIALEEYESEFENGVPNRYISKWVKIKTAIDFINTAYLNIAKNIGSNQKTVGDISVSKSSKLPYLTEILRKLKEDLEDIEDYFDGEDRCESVVRAGQTEYPISERVSF